MAFGLFRKSAAVAPSPPDGDFSPPLKLPPADAPRRRPNWLLFFLPRGKGSKRSAKVAASSSSARPEKTIIVLGCDGAGKSTLIAALGDKTIDDITPTVGFSHNKGALGGAPLVLFDVGGGKQIRGIWQEYYADAHAALFVVDASDPDRFGEAAELLHSAAAHDALHGKPILVFANKQDKAQAAPAAELLEALRAHELQDSAYHVAAGSLAEGATALAPAAGAAEGGLQAGLAWLLDTVGADFAALQERVERQAAEQKAREAREKAERKERLAKRRAEREAREAAEAAEAAAAAAPTPAAADAATPADAAAPAGVEVGLPA